MKNIFIIGSKGIPAKYGGFETFVDNLVIKQKNKDINYYVSCLSKENSEFRYHNSLCFNIKVPNIGPAKAIYYDILSLLRSVKYIKENKIDNATIYILACRIGPFMNLFKRTLKKLNINVFVNPDGHEWKRSKWSLLVRKYWKYSEKLMVKHADLLICDNGHIKNYIQTEYKKYKPNTTFIPYGSNIPNKSNLEGNLDKWLNKHSIIKNNYYLIVGRFVPENNYELMIKEFIKSETKKHLVIISNVEMNKFYNTLLRNTNFDKDNRIKFVGTVYDSNLLDEIRSNAYGYIHGHEVGGTNPSLLEALACTKINLLLKVGFNEEVGNDSSLYFSKNNNDLALLINKVDLFSTELIDEYGKKAKARIIEEYNWNKIVSTYEKLFLNT